MATGTFIEKALIKSPAFLSLTRKAPHVLLLFLLKRQLKKISGKRNSAYAIANNGEIEFSFSEAKKLYGFTEGVFNRARSQLIEHGFLRVESCGGLCKTANKYFLAEDWRKYDTPDFKPMNRQKRNLPSVGFQPGNKLGKNSKQNADVIHNTKTTVVSIRNKSSPPLSATGTLFPQFELTPEKPTG